MWRKLGSSEEKCIHITLFIAVVLMLKRIAGVSLGKDMMASIPRTASMNQVHVY